MCVCELVARETVRKLFVAPASTPAKLGCLVELGLRDARDCPKTLCSAGVNLVMYDVEREAGDSAKPSRVRPSQPLGSLDEWRRKPKGE